MLKIHESIADTGEASPVFLRAEAGALVLVDSDGELALPEGALDAVMDRYGAPLEPSETLACVAALDLGEGRALRHVRHLAVYDVIAKDYLVYDRPDREPLCALATAVSAVLGHLARAAARSSP